MASLCLAQHAKNHTWEEYKNYNSQMSSIAGVWYKAALGSARVSVQGGWRTTFALTLVATNLWVSSGIGHKGWGSVPEINHRDATGHWRIIIEKVADSARTAVKLAERYKPYGEQFVEFSSISLSTYQTCMKFTRKSTEFCQFSASIIRICLDATS